MPHDAAWNANSSTNEAVWRHLTLGPAGGPVALSLGSGSGRRPRFEEVVREAWAMKLKANHAFTEPSKAEQKIESVNKVGFQSTITVTNRPFGVDQREPDGGNHGDPGCCIEGVTPALVDDDGGGYVR